MQATHRLMTPTVRSAWRVGRGVLAGMLAVLMLSSVTGPAAAQDPGADDARRYTLALRNVPLDEALQAFIQRTNTDIAYSNELVEGRSVYCRERDATTETLLRCILTGTGLDYVQTARGTYLLVESFRAPDPKGHIAGTVVDALTGEPLPQANVLLADASTGTATNQAGQFNLTSVLAGAHQLVITYVGYAPHVDTVWVPPAGRQNMRVALTPKPVQTEPLVVDGLQQRLPSDRLGRDRLANDALAQPSEVGTVDFIRHASRHVGVTLNQPQAALHVQGGGTGEHTTLLDAVPVRKPLSLGGVLSAFSPVALGRITVHKAGFGAEHGSYTAGLIEAEHDLARSSLRYGTALADPLSANGRGEATWSAGQMGTGHAMVAARTSMWEAYRSPALDHLLSTWTQPDPTLTAWWLDPDAAAGQLTTQRPSSLARFRDVHGAVRQDLTPFQQLYVSGYHGSSTLGTDVQTALTGDAETQLIATRGRTGWTNTMGQVRYDWMASARATGRLQGYGSRHTSHSDFGLRDTLVQSGASTPLPVPPSVEDAHAVDHGVESNALTEWGGRADVDVSVTPSVSITASLAAHHREGQVQVRNRFLGALDHRIRTWNVTGHVQSETALGLGTTLTAGTRLTYLAPQRTVFWEPRLSVRYDRSTSSIGPFAARLAGGLYRQYVMQSELSNDGPMAVVPSMQFWLPLDASLPPPRAYHTAAEALLMPSDAWSLRLETFYKWQPRTLQIDYAALVRAEPLQDAQMAPATVFERQAEFMAAGVGRAYGVALHVQREGERVSANGSIELQRAQRQYPGRFEERFVPVPWEQPVRARSDVEVRLVRGLYAVGSWEGVWGRSWALRRAYYDYAALTQDASTIEGLDVHRPGDQVLAPLSRFDLGLRAERSVRGVTVELRTHVVNVFDRANAFDWSLTTSGSVPRRHVRTLPGRRLFVLLGVRY